MEHDTHKLLSTAKDLREPLKVIENLLEDYDGIEGNEFYVKYCLKKARQANVFDGKLKEYYNDMYNTDTMKRKEIDADTLYGILGRLFKLLDDIDTAGDMFKPKWCKYTKAVEALHKLRWLYCYIERYNGNENGLMTVNRSCDSERIALRF